MKSKLFLLTMLLPSAVMAQDIHYKLNGKIGHVGAPAKVYMSYTQGNTDVLDSALIHDGVFQFTGTLKNPAQATLVLSYLGKPTWKGGESMLVYLEDGKVTIKSPDSLSHAVVKGKKENVLASKIENALRETNQKMRVLTSELSALPVEKKKDKDFMKGFMDSYIRRQKIILNDQHEIRSGFIRKYPNSVVSLDQILTINKFFNDFSYLSSLYEGLSDQVKQTANGQVFGAKLALMKVTEMGSVAIDFTQKDTKGKIVRLSDFRGRYVLVDFWASWCYACRMENPNVVKAYAKYHDKGLEILGVSLDDEKTKDAWLAAIKHDGLTWPQVSDLKGWQNEAAMRYGIKAIPQNVLLDGSGKIIAKNIRAEALEAKLAEIFK